MHARSQKEGEKEREGHPCLQITLLLLNSFFFFSSKLYHTSSIVLQWVMGKSSQVPLFALLLLIVVLLLCCLLLQIAESSTACGSSKPNVPCMVYVFPNVCSLFHGLASRGSFCTEVKLLLIEYIRQSDKVVKFICMEFACMWGRWFGFIAYCRLLAECVGERPDVVN